MRTFSLLLDSALLQQPSDSLETLHFSLSKSTDMHFSKEDLIDKLLFASVTGNGTPSVPKY